VLAWLTSFVGAYAFNSRFTFKMSMSRERAALFFSTSIATLIISSLVVAILSNAIGVWPAKIAAMGVSFSVGFLLARAVAFRPASPNG
jgi:putative flippase GtrA